VFLLLLLINMNVWVNLREPQLNLL
jgi:hypothetical protein